MVLLTRMTFASTLYMLYLTRMYLCLSQLVCRYVVVVDVDVAVFFVDLDDVRTYVVVIVVVVGIMVDVVADVLFCSSNTFNNVMSIKHGF